MRSGPAYGLQAYGGSLYAAMRVDGATADLGGTVVGFSAPLPGGAPDVPWTFVNLTTGNVPFTAGDAVAVSITQAEPSQPYGTAVLDGSCGGPGGCTPLAAFNLTVRENTTTLSAAVRGGADTTAVAYEFFGALLRVTQPGYLVSFEAQLAPLDTASGVRVTLLRSQDREVLYTRLVFPKNATNDPFYRHQFVLRRADWIPLNAGDVVQVVHTTGDGNQTVYTAAVDGDTGAALSSVTLRTRNEVADDYSNYDSEPSFMLQNFYVAGPFAITAGGFIDSIDIITEAPGNCDIFVNVTRGGVVLVNAGRGSFWKAAVVKGNAMFPDTIQWRGVALDRPLTVYAGDFVSAYQTCWGMGYYGSIIGNWECSSGGKLCTTVMRFQVVTGPATYAGE